MRSKNGLSRETGNYGHKIQTKQANDVERGNDTLFLLLVLLFNFQTDFVRILY
jgi:hypothetical protein